MAKASMTELQRQLEAIRHEAFAAGYAAAMEAVHELASRAAPQAEKTAGLGTRQGRAGHLPNTYRGGFRRCQVKKG
jgi:hypothetical protein